MSLIAVNMMLGRAAVDPSVPLGLLAKLTSWYAFEDSLADAWGVLPLDQSASGITYADASTGGAGVSGRCVSAGRVTSRAQFPQVTTAYRTLVAMISTDAFAAGAVVCGISQDSAADISLARVTEASAASAQWQATGLAVGSTPTGSVSGPGSQAVNSWHLIGYSSISSGTAYLHYDGARRYASAATGVILTPKRAAIGDAATGTSSKIATLAVMAGEPTPAEWAYLYNSGAGRELSGVLTDAGYVLPACRLTGAFATVPAVMTTSYDGLTVATPDNADGTNYSRAGNTSRSSGKRWFAVQCLTALAAGGSSTTLWLAIADATTRAGLRCSGPLQGQVSVAGSVTDGTDPGATTGVGAAGDWFMLCYDGATGKFWVGKNNVFSGDPVAGTGQAATFTGAPALFPMIVSAEAACHMKFAFKTGEMPYSNPSGFTPWGD